MANMLNIFRAFWGSRNSEKGRRIFWSAAAGCIIAFTSGCNSASTNPDAPLKTVGSSDESPQTRPMKAVWSDPILSSDGPGREAWRQFVADGRYRLARLEDLTFSEKVKDKINKNSDRQYGKEQDRTFGLAFIYMWGDLNHDGLTPDLVAIIVDTQATSANRFGIVAFNALNKGERSSRPIWIYKDKDLSKVHLGSWSAGAYIAYYDDEGRIDAGFLNWNRKSQRYSFDDVYRTPK